jgi:hypothetical protein
MSFQLARLDASKSCDSHAIVMRKERRGVSLSGNGREKLWPERERWASAMLPDAAGFVALVRRSQSDGGFWNNCPRFIAPKCIHDVVPVIDGQNLLTIQPHLN